MSFFDKLFGKKPAPAPEPAAPAQVSIPEPATVAEGLVAGSADPDEADKPQLIKIFDSYGRELMIPRAEWRDKILMSNLQEAWNEPDKLGPLIVQALRDQFYSEVIGAAEQVQRIDPNPARGAVLLGLVYQKNDRLKDAEEVLNTYLTKHGDNGVVYTNLAKIYIQQGEESRAEETLWRGLQVDPNQDNGVAMYEHLCQEKGGEAAGLEASRRLAALPGSWRAQLTLARAALKAGDLEKAQSLHQECLAHCGRPVPPDVLMQISGDLGLTGHLMELVQVTEPLFDPALHGLPVGNNLFRAYLDLGQLDQARELVDQLYAQQRPDWKESLGAWDTQLAQAGVEISPADPQKPIRIAILNIEGPVWLNASAPGAELFEAKEDYSLRIAFLGSSGEIPAPAEQVERQLADAPGRLSRMIPLYLAEQIHLGTDERAQALIPWIAEKDASGFVFSGHPWETETAVQIATQGEVKNDYLVVSHLIAKGDIWTVELRLLRTIDGTEQGALSASFPPDSPQDALPQLSRQLMELLETQAEAELKGFPQAYQIPSDNSFPLYLLRLEQLLAIRCAATDGTPSGFLNGEREIVDGTMQLCLAHPESATLRLLLAQTLLSMRKVRPDIMPEFRDKIQLLQSEKPLAPPAHGVLKRMMDEAVRV